MIDLFVPTSFQLFTHSINLKLPDCPKLLAGERLCVGNGILQL
jgi:hypothetical protein